MTDALEAPEFKTRAAPVSGGERIATVDVVRGFAILGILLVNIYGFSGLQLDPLSTTDRLDRSVIILVILLAQAKFYSLFSFLFGWGMSIQLERALQRGARFVRLYLRRMIVLLLIGVLHGIFLWAGDILTTYALLGTLLLLFRKSAPRRLLLLVGLFLLSAIVVVIPGQAMDQARDLYAQATQFMRPVNMPPQTIYGHGFLEISSFLEISQRRMGEFFGSQSWFIYWLGNVFGMMLLGLYAGRRRLFQDVEANLPLIRKTLWLGLVVGLLFNAIAVWFTGDSGDVGQAYQRFIRVSARTIGAPALMLFYASGLVLLMRKEVWRQRLGRLAPVGRMALSNYLFQSVVAGSIFYRYGLGLYDRITPTFALLTVIAIYVAQIYISEWWLERYRFGPAEWLWRTLTYGRWQPLRRQQLTFLDREPAHPSPFSRFIPRLDWRYLLVLTWIGLIAWAGVLYAWNSRLDRRAGENTFTLFSQETTLSPVESLATATPVRPVAIEPEIEALATPVVRPADYRPSTAASVGDVQAMTAAIDVEQALAHINTLAGPEYAGRLAGSEGGWAAGDYIAAMFAQYGLQPASLDGTFFQSFPITYTTLTDLPQLEVTLADGSPAGDYTLYEHFSPFVTGYAGNGQGSGSVYWLNQCRPQDFADRDLLGKIVFCKPEPGNDALILSSRLALEYGADGLLLLTNEEPRPADFASRHQELWVPETIPVLRVYPPLGEDLLTGSGLTIEELLRTDEPLALRTSAFLSVSTSDSTRVTSRNVLGVLPGRDPEYAGEVIVIGAHYDHMGQGPDGTLWAGANDNASGVAAVLEIARSWQTLGYVPRRTVLFAAWDAEEWGLIGSTYYVEHPSYPLESTLASFQLDMVGSGPGVLDVSGDRDLAQQQLAIAEGMGIEVVNWDVGRSDHVPFLEAGVPATLLNWFSGVETNTHYHRPTDQPDVIEPERLDTVFEVTNTTVLDLVESVPAIEQLVAQRSAAATDQNLSDFLSTSAPEQITTDSKWFADLQMMTPLTIEFSLQDIQFQAGLAMADVTIEVAYGQENEHLRLSQPVHFSHGEAGWRWVGPALSWYEPSKGDDADNATETRVTIGYPLGADQDQAPLATLIAERYDQVSSRLVLSQTSDIKLMLLPDEEAIRFSSGLSVAADRSVWIEPGMAHLVYTRDISQSQQMADAIVQLVLADAGIREQAAPWLWQGLPVAWQASQNLKLIHNEHLPRLTAAFAAAEPPPDLTGSWAAVEYLIQKLGWDGVGRFIQDFGQACAKDGCDTAAGVDRAMIAALEMDLATFNAAWLEQWRSQLNQVQVNLDRLLHEREQALLAGDRLSFLATLNAADPYLVASEGAWFDHQAVAPVSDLSLAAQPMALLANGDVVAAVTLNYPTVGQDGQPQHYQSVVDVLFTTTGDGYKWAGYPSQILTGDVVAIRYPDGQLPLAQALLDQTEDTYARLAGALQIEERQPIMVELYPDRESFRLAVGLAYPTSGWLPAWSEPGSGIKVQHQGSETVEVYRAALTYQLARYLLYQQGIADEWLLKGISSQLSIAAGNWETQSALSTALIELLGAGDGLDDAGLASIPADELLSNPAWLARTAMAWDSLVHLTATEGWPAVLSFLNLAAKTGDAPAAFATVFGQSVAAFEAEWRALAASGYAAPEWTEASAALDADRSLEHVRFLGGDALAGRQAGTPGGEIAANYVARRFADYGLQPLGDLYPGSYHQTFLITYTERSGEPLLQILDDPEPYRFREHFLSVYSTLDTSPAQGELVWLGGAADEDVDLGGKIALAMADDDVATILESALDRNAAGLLLLGFKSEVVELYAKQPLVPAILADIPVLELARDGTLRLLELLDFGYDTIQDLPAGTPLEVQARLASRAFVRGQVTTSNVLGLLPGSDPLLGQQVIIIGAHYDHVGDDPAVACDRQDGDCPPGVRYSGLNDNASGVAIMLEIARLWQESGYRPKYSVLFAAWGAQEAGQLGSNYYVQNPALPLDNTVAVLQLDGLGGGGGFYPGLHAQTEADSYLIHFITAAAERLEQKIVQIPSSAESDRLPFSEQGIPAALFSWRLADENNLPDGLANGVSPERIAASGRVVVLALMMMAR